VTQLPTASGAYAGSSGGGTAPGITIGGRYALRAAVGHGGMGTVWQATDTLLHRDVAVKEVVLPPGLAASDREAMCERTLREARAAAALSHPAVVQVYDVVTEGGRPWIVMELLDARSLADLIIEDGPASPRAVAKIGIALLGALEVAHAVGVLHRDVKPANVLICPDGRCVLTDFGVARMPTDVQLTTPGMVLGSPHFISPERAMGHAFGPPSDLFSLGVTLYTAVEGRPPFDKGDPIETMHAVVEDPPTPPTRAGALAEVLYGLLEKDPARRWNVPAARGRLRELLGGALASTSPGHFATDPYAVVPAQRAAPGAESASPAGPGGRAGSDVPGGPMGTGGPGAPGGQIGGRAMLGPHETVTGRLSGLSPTGLPHAMEHTNPDGPRWDAAGQMWPAGDRPPTAGASTSGRARTWSRKLQLLAAAGVAVVALLGVALATNLGSGPESRAAGEPTGTPSPTPSGPPFPVQTFSERGVSVNLPAEWKENTARNYVDFVDPAESTRRARLLFEPADGEPVRFMEIAEKGLKRNCTKPYARVDLSPEQLAGSPAAQLEYTCGTGEKMRHGVWRAIVVGGTAYSFYLTTTDDEFQSSRPIFDEMVRSFELTASG
jgi:hypothetical protein